MHNSSEDANAVRNLRSALSVVGVGWQPITGGNFNFYCVREHSSNRKAGLSVVRNAVSCLLKTR